MIVLSHFRSLSNPHAKRIEFPSWNDAVRWLRQDREHVRKGSDGKGWSPATFLGDHRKLEKVETVSALVWDYDRGSTLEDIEGFLYGTAFWAHESRSSSEKHQKWRVVSFISRPVSGPEYSDLWSAMSEVAGGVYSISNTSGALDGSTKDPSRFWFLPCRLANGDSPTCVFRNGDVQWHRDAKRSRLRNGSLIDVDAELARYRAQMPPESRAPRWDPGQATGESKRARISLSKRCELIASTGSGSRHETIRTAALLLGHYLASSELDEQFAIDSLLDAATACGYMRDYGEATALRVIEFGLHEGRKAGPPSVPLRQQRRQKPG